MKTILQIVISIFILYAACEDGSVHGTDSINYASGLPRFTVLMSENINDPPKINVIFANGEEDEIDLTHHRLHESFANSCNYLGNLRNSAFSSVAVTGCLNKPEDKMEITLISNLNQHTIFTVDMDGKTKSLASPFAEGVVSRAIVPKQALPENGWAQMGDEVVNAQIEKDADATKYTTIPSKLKAVIKFGYDEGIKNRLSQQGQTFQQWIEGVLTHAQAHFKHPSLGTQIEFEVQGDPIFKSGVQWTADNNIYDARTATLEANLNGVDAMSWWCNSGGGGVAGVAFLGALCSSYNTNLNEYWSTQSGAGFILAHELGHNFGMRHDFDETHGGSNGPCNRQGIMSYGSFSYNQWSTCSKSDWEHHYSSRNWGNGCLEDISGESTTEPQPTTQETTTKSPADCYDDIEDGWYEGEIIRNYVTRNKEECGKSCCENIDCAVWVWRVFDWACHLKKGDNLIHHADSGHWTAKKATTTVNPTVSTATTSKSTTTIIASTTTSPECIDKEYWCSLADPNCELEFVKERCKKQCNLCQDSCYSRDTTYTKDPVRGIKNFHIKGIKSLEDCQKECVKDPDCNYFTWNSPDFWKARKRNTCWLKAGRGKIKQDCGKACTGKISGPKKCDDETIDGIGVVLSCKSQKIALKTHFGKYVVAESDGKANANRNLRRGWETFTVEKLGGDKISLKSSHGKYLVAEANYEVNANRAGRGGWEIFVLERHEGGKIALKTAHGRYVVAENDGRLRADRTKALAWEQFLPECID